MAGKQKLNLDKVKAEIKNAIQKKNTRGRQDKKHKTKQENRDQRDKDCTLHS